MNRLWILRIGRLAFVAGLVFASLAPVPLAAQEVTPIANGNGALRVFFDCDGGRGMCDFDFYRREIPYVNYTRDREDAQVHVLMTSEDTGSGGRRFTLDFIGREEFAEVTDRLEVVTRPNLALEQRLTGGR
ncbi:MAG: hypothetical protein F4X22_09795 [Gemmatimonadales bacterium]|nr:hypothetical protein [Candidatus Palauibacter denitrificans]